MAGGIRQIGFAAATLRSCGIAVGCVSLVAPALAGDPPARFFDEALNRGVSYSVPQRIGAEFAFGRGLGFADLDNDGDQDLVVLGSASGEIGVFENDGAGAFLRPATLDGVPTMETASGVSFADYDADGDIDMFITSYTSRDALLRNEGGFAFSDRSAIAGVDDMGAGTGSSWADVNDDGWLDLYVANRTGTTRMDLSELAMEPNRLYINQGDGTFDEQAALWGVASDGPSFQGTFFDYDDDGDMDLYIAEDKGVQHCLDFGFGDNKLYRNEGGFFVEIARPSGVVGCLDAMCATVGDFDADNDLDLYVTNTPGGNALFVNQGAGQFVDEADRYGARGFHIGWGAAFFDCDNNGASDLYVCSATGPNFLFGFAGADTPMDNLGPVMGVHDSASSYAVATADIDTDGDVDLVVSSLGAPNIRLYVNEATQGRSWVRVRPLGPYPNTQAVGAIVELQINGEWRREQVLAGSGYKGQNQLAPHFGLGSSEIVDAIRVTWPDGHSRTLENVTARRELVLRRCPADLDTDGAQTMDDFAVFASAFTNGHVADADFTDARAPHPGFPRFGVPDGKITPADFAAFAFAYASGCPAE